MRRRFYRLERNQCIGIVHRYFLGIAGIFFCFYLGIDAQFGWIHWQAFICCGKGRLKFIGVGHNRGRVLS